ncbi:MAG: hypothetical protein P8X55_19810 [Desulfosarcinaceae bacterium]
MYLARTRKKNGIHYTIRQSYRDEGCYKSRDVFDLGPDPSSYIIYPGGNSYYLDPVIEEGLAEAGLDIDGKRLDDLFFEFLDPGVQKVITGFDRRWRGAGLETRGSVCRQAPVHFFDKQRFHFLRYGQSRQRFLNRVPEKYFDPLRAKSRDEIEHDFLLQENKLRHQELPVYIAVIFTLDRFVPDMDDKQSIQSQRDLFFMERLCRLYADDAFWSGVSKPVALPDYLARYAIAYFDTGIFPQRPAWMAYAEAFINGHRSYVPPAKVRASMERAARLFGIPWNELKAMDRRGLTRLYRRLALKHHPDQGGEKDTFLELTRVYGALLRRKPKG